MTDHRPDSPDLLAAAGPVRAGVRRLNRVPFMIALLILALVTGAIFYTYWQRLQQANAAKDRSDSKIGVLANAPDGGFIQPKASETIPALAAAPAAPPPVPELPKVNPYQHEWEEFMQRSGADAPGARATEHRGPRRSIVRQRVLAQTARHCF